MTISSATVILTDDRFDNVVVSWIIGTSKLQLCHKGEYVLGPNGEGMKWQPASVLREFVVKGGVNHDNVEDEARKLFDTVGSIFEPDVVYAEGDEWSE